MKAVALYYTDNRRFPGDLGWGCWRRLHQATWRAGVPLLYVGREAFPGRWLAGGCAAAGEPVVLHPRDCEGGAAERILRALLAGLNALDDLPVLPEWVYLCEHDVLYVGDHFGLHQVETGGRLVYDTRVVRLTPRGWLRYDGGFGLQSGLCAERECLRAVVESRLEGLASGERYRWGELGREDGFGRVVRQVTREGRACVDLRWGGNLTGARNAPGVHASEPGWGDWRAVWRELGCEPEACGEKVVTLSHANNREED